VRAVREDRQGAQAMGGEVTHETRD
jgi:hypothetical protein